MLGKRGVTIGIRKYDHWLCFRIVVAII